MSDQPEPHPANVSGDFYVTNGCCLSCDVPRTLAPELFAYDGRNHCYVQRQPVTPEEFFRMLRATWTSEVECIR